MARLWTLRAARRAAVFSVAELAKASGVHEATLLRIEAGQRSPHPSTRRRVAGALGLQPSEILWPERADEQQGR